MSPIQEFYDARANHSAVSRTLKRALKGGFPEASDDQILHQLEYLGASVCGGEIKLRGGSYGEHPTLLYPFNGREDPLLDHLQDILQKEANDGMSTLRLMVAASIRNIRAWRVEPESIWLSNKSNRIIQPSRYFSGYPVRYHEYKEEFIISLACGRSSPLEAP